MTELTIMRKRGQITLPKAIRKKAGIKDDAPVFVKLFRGKVTIEPVIVSPYEIRLYTDEEIKEFLEEDKLDPILAKKVEKLLAE